MLFQQVQKNYRNSTNLNKQKAPFGAFAIFGACAWLLVVFSHHSKALSRADPQHFGTRSLTTGSAVRALDALPAFEHVVVQLAGVACHHRPALDAQQTGEQLDVLCLGQLAAVAGV